MCLLWPFVFRFHTSFLHEKVHHAHVLHQTSAAFIFKQKHPMNPIVSTFMERFKCGLIRKLINEWEMRCDQQQLLSSMLLLHCQALPFNMISRQSNNDYIFYIVRDTSWHIFVHTRNVMWPHVAQTTSKCGLIDQITMHLWDAFDPVHTCI